jgi:hypothetical protein
METGRFYPRKARHIVNSSSRLGNLKAAAVAVGVLLIAVGVALPIVTIVFPQVAAWARVIAFGIFFMLAGVAVITYASMLRKTESNTFRLYNQAIDLFELARRQEQLLSRIAENTALSDGAKSLANRDKECEALRATIRAEIRTEQWDAALALAQAMVERFGYAEEAAALRTEVNEARTETLRRRFEQAAAHVTGLLDTFAWDKAAHEIERLYRALPDEPRIAKLRQLYESRRASRKNELIKAWNSAVQRNEVDEAIDTLRQLDIYLTREEARTLEQSARGIFKAKLLQLGAQFQFAVKDQRWRDAIEIGLQLCEEFPNSRMSQEVSQAMEGLRHRAGLHGDVDVVATPHAR